MVGQLSWSLGLFAIVWGMLCAVSSAVVTDALLRSHQAGSTRGEDEALGDGTSQRTGG